GRALTFPPVDRGLRGPGPSRVTLTREGHVTGSSPPKPKPPRVPPHVVTPKAPRVPEVVTVVVAEEVVVMVAPPVVVMVVVVVVPPVVVHRQHTAARAWQARRGCRAERTCQLD